MVIAADSRDPREFPCLHRDGSGRVLHCPELRRLVVDFHGHYLVLRIDEFRALLDFLRGLLACRLACARLERGDRLRLRDARGEPTLILDLAQVGALADLLAAGAERLASRTPDTDTP